MAAQAKALRKYLGCFSLLFALAACGEVGVNYPTLDFTTLISRAKKEGQVISVGMHDGWPTGQKMWDDLNLYYGLKDQDTDMGSEKILKCFRGDSDALVSSPDIGDIGLEYAREAKSQGLLAGYKTSYWDEIPSWAKDDERTVHRQFHRHFGLPLRFRFRENAPKSFADSPKAITKSASPASPADRPANSPFMPRPWLSAAASTTSNRGSPSSKIGQQGRLVENLKTDNLPERLRRQNPRPDQLGFLGAWPIGMKPPRGARRKVMGLASLPMGSVTSGYATIISKNAKHPYAAMLAREYILSDAGQLNIAALYATPIRSVKLPSDLENKRIPRYQYTSSQTSMGAKFTLDLSKKIKTAWEAEVETERVSSAQ
jgi:putative spermidine/putrescine transport system substrate-binding protein